jgi:hypothetical protein
MNFLSKLTGTGQTGHSGQVVTSRAIKENTQGPEHAAIRHQPLKE